jgi:hypothetical protein
MSKRSDKAVEGVIRLRWQQYCNPIESHMGRLIEAVDELWRDDLVSNDAAYAFLTQATYGTHLEDAIEEHTDLEMDG